MSHRNYNLAMNLFTRELAELAGKKYSKEIYVRLATTVTKGGKIKKATKSGHGYVDGYIEGIGIIERKASDLAKVTIQTGKNYVNDAVKYIGRI